MVTDAHIAQMVELLGEFADTPEVGARPCQGWFQTPEEDFCFVHEFGYEGWFPMDPKTQRCTVGRAHDLLVEMGIRRPPPEPPKP